MRPLLLAASLALLACGLPAPALAATTPILTAPAPGYVADANVHVAWSESDALGTSTFDVWVSPPDCSTAGAPAQTVPADALQTDYATDVTLDGGDGPYCVTVVAHDVLGVDPPGASAAVVLDTTPPHPPGSPDATNPPDQFPQLEWGPGAGDAGGSGVAAYAVYRNGVVIHTEPVGDGSRRTFVDTGAAAGTTEYAITVSDLLGHESAPVTLEARYDGPSATIVDHPPDPSRSAQATFSFSASEPGAFRCSLDGGADADCTSPDSLTGLADGDHTFHVHAVDQNGTPGGDDTFSWTVDTSAAGFTLNGPSGLIDHGDVTYTFTSGDPGSSFTCQLDADATEPCTSPKSYGLADGPHRVTVTATDSAGNVQSDFRDVTVDTAGADRDPRRRPAAERHLGLGDVRLARQRERRDLRVPDRRRRARRLPRGGDLPPPLGRPRTSSRCAAPIPRATSGRS